MEKPRPFFKSLRILLGLFLISVFGMRFVWEYFKVVQVDFEETMALNMGQL